MGMPELLVEGEVIEVDPPRRLVQTWRAAWDPDLVAEGFTRVTWEISEEDAGVAQLTVTHELRAHRSTRPRSRASLRSRRAAAAGRGSSAT